MLLQNLHPRGFGLISVLPLEHSVLVAGATGIIDRARRVRGSGNLLEIGPTTSTTVAIEITPEDSAKHQAAGTIADSQMLGRTVSKFECVESQDGSACSELASQSDPHSRLVHLVDGAWQLVPRFDLPIFVLNIADAGPDAIWVTGFDRRTFKSSLMVFLADGQICAPGENGSNNARLTPLGEGRWIASDPSHLESSENFVAVYTAIPRPSERD